MSAVPPPQHNSSSEDPDRVDLDPTRPDATNPDATTPDPTSSESTRPESTDEAPAWHAREAEYERKLAQSTDDDRPWSERQWHVAPQKRSKVNTRAMLAHLANLSPAALFGAAIIWRLAKDAGGGQENDFIRKHAATSANAVATVLLVSFVSGLLVPWEVLGVPMVIVMLYMLICSIMGAVAAIRGKTFTYPATLPLLK